MKIFLTGANGQLGKACQQVFQDDELFLADRENCDITDPVMVHQAIKMFEPNVVLHTAAYTNVTGAETDQAVCYAVNVVGTFQIARAAAELEARLIYISTDFVFDGQQAKPYSESALPHPLNVYGRSKLAGEYITRDLASDALVVRTSGVFGDGKNFMQTMLRLAETKDELSVVADQWTRPTFALDLATTLKQLLERQVHGVVHVTNAGESTWAEVAREVFQIAGKETIVHDIATADYADTTPRPLKACLSTAKLEQELGISMRDWREALRVYLDVAA